MLAIGVSLKKIINNIVSINMIKTICSKNKVNSFLGKILTNARSFVYFGKGLY